MFKKCHMLAPLLLLVACQAQTAPNIHSIPSVSSTPSQVPVRGQGGAPQFPQSKSQPLPGPSPSVEETPSIPSGTGENAVSEQESPEPETPVVPTPTPYQRPAGGSSSGGGGGGGGPSVPSTYQLTNIALKSTGESLVGESAAASLQGQFSGADISLLLQGQFSQPSPIGLDQMRFTYEPGLVHQSFLGSAPSVRVLLDQHILLEPTQVSASQIEVNLNTQGLGELYLKGLHSLKLVVNGQSFEKQVLVGDPTEIRDLTPSVTAVEVIKNAQNQPTHLKLKGSRMLLTPQNVQVRVDGAVYPMIQTNILENGTTEALIQIPDATVFEQETNHTLFYTTPFGTHFTGFTDN